MYKPRWLEEFGTYRTIKSAFVLEGQIADMQLWDSDTTGMDMKNLPEYLHICLCGIGYQNVIFYNRVDGFGNDFDDSGEMMKRFTDLSGVRNKGKGVCIADATKAVRQAMTNQESATVVIMDLASLMLMSPDHPQESEIENFATLLLATREARTAPAARQGEYLNNLFFLLVDKANDLPPWFYLNNPYVKVLSIPKPDQKMRQTLLEAYCCGFLGWDACTGEEQVRQLRHLVAISEGFSYIEMERILSLCMGKGTPLKDVADEFNAYRYGRKDNPWSQLSPTELRNLESSLSKDVIGQGAAVRAVSEVIKRSACGLSGLQHSSSSRPKGVLFFAGPTGTGKTELAKALTRKIFGDESALIRFDMSEYGHEQSDQRLLGAPPGYVGYNEGGELTNAVRAHPFSILLFDEIEKAHPSIMDKFLQILDDGRMTDSKGDTVYFTETVIIFTSNAGIYRMMPDGTRASIVSEHNSYAEIEASVREGLRDYFVSQLNRPEILNRIGNNIVVFDFIRPQAVPAILGKQIKNICSNLADSHNIRLELPQDTPAWQFLEKRAMENLSFGGRGIGNIVEKYLINPLGVAMSDNGWQSGQSFRITDLVEEAQGVVLKYEQIGG